MKNVPPVTIPRQTAQNWTQTPTCLCSSSKHKIMHLRLSVCLSIVPVLPFTVSLNCKYFAWQTAAMQLRDPSEMHAQTFKRAHTVENKLHVNECCWMLLASLSPLHGGGGGETSLLLSSPKRPHNRTVWWAQDCNLSGSTYRRWRPLFKVTNYPVCCKRRMQRTRRCSFPIALHRKQLQQSSGRTTRKLADSRVQNLKKQTGWHH